MILPRAGKSKTTHLGISLPGDKGGEMEMSWIDGLKMVGWNCLAVVVLVVLCKWVRPR